MNKKISSNEIREKFLKFFEKRNHKIIPSAPLVPENDPSVLFNTAGMQPLVPYLLGEKHPNGTRIVDVQKCVRTGDIDEVGDNTHHTFFEMLGNWSLGDYFKEEAIKWSYQFLTSKEEGIGLDPSRLYVTVFVGDENAPKDTEAYEVWKKIFEDAGLDPEKRIFWMSAESNWWAAGDNGPCGPDSEMFYDRTLDGLGGLTKEEFLEADEKQQVVEIWNDVFMEFEKKDGKVIGKLSQKNIDTGAGFERLVSVVENKESAYETSLFVNELKILEEKTGKKYLDFKKDFRVILDHIRTSIFLLSDGVFPSNKDQGYVLRKLLRRSVLKMKNIGFDYENVNVLVKSFIEQYGKTYENLIEKKEKIIQEISLEISKFEKTLVSGLKEFEKIIDTDASNNHIQRLEFGMCLDYGYALNEISGKDAFKLFSTYGFPLELIKEEAEKRGFVVNEEEFNKLFSEHMKKSKDASFGKFKGGLAGDTPKTRALHTATHLLLAGLRKFLGEEVTQAGSNITEDRIRFDFTYHEKVGREVLDKIEDYVNSVIKTNAKIIVEEMPKEQAKQEGVVGAFWDKYPDIVKVWTIKDDAENIYSRELCGGPHVINTSELSEFGVFKIGKEQSSSAGVRRVKATLI